MHNAKEDGVSLFLPLAPLSLSFSNGYHARPLAHVLSSSGVIRDEVFLCGGFLFFLCFRGGPIGC